MQPRLFFITGRGRSGTWLLRTILDTHPKLSVAPESLFTLQLYKKYERFKDWNKRAIHSFIEDLSKDQKITQWWKIDLITLRDSMLDSGIKNYNDACIRVYRQYALENNKPDTQLVGDKNPEYSLKIDSIRTVFPDAPIILLIRDPRDNVTSFRKVSFDLDNPISLAARWKFYNNRILDALRKHDKIYLFRYEELISSPVKMLNSICKVLDIEYDENLLLFHKNAKNVFSWNKKITEKLNIDNINKWKNLPNQETNDKIARICSSLIDEFGYDKGNPIELSIMDRIHYLNGMLFCYLELLFYHLPLSMSQKILNLYRKKNKIFPNHE